MKSAIVVFPGTNRERDMAIALKRVTGKAPTMLWHRDTDLPDVDLVVLPGGFSYGDYLRCGAMAAHSPIMAAIRAFAQKGGHILGVCNGFQILTETGLLPGALLRNANLRFLSPDRTLRVERADPPIPHRRENRATFPTPLPPGVGTLTADCQTLSRLHGDGRGA